MISDTIFEILHEKKMTQKEFSHQTGIPQSTISDWKHKRLNPSADKLGVIAKVLGVTTGELLGVSDENRNMSSLMISLTEDEQSIIDIFRQSDVSMQNRILHYFTSLNSITPTNERISTSHAASDSLIDTGEIPRLTNQKRLALKLRKLAHLGRLRLDETEHANGRNLHLLHYLDYIGMDRLDYIRQYLATIQPFMITEFSSQEAFPHAICVLDNLYRISIYIKIDASQNEEIVVSFHENNKSGIAKRNSERINDEYVYVIPDSLGSRSGDTYTVNLFITRGVRTFPINVPATRFDEDGFVVRFIYINNALIDFCNKHLEDLYTADLDYSQIELFGTLTQLSFSSYGNDSFSNISILVDSILIQKNALGKQISDSALCIYCSSLTLDMVQKEELISTLKERYSVNSVKILPELIERISTNFL